MEQDYVGQEWLDLLPHIEDELRMEAIFEHVTEDCQCEGKQCHNCDIVYCVGLYAKELRVKDGLTGSCLTCRRGFKRAWRQRNPEYIREDDRKRRKPRYSRNPEYFIERSREYKRLHPEYNREYARTHPEMIRTKTANRRARRKNAIGKYMIREWEAVKAQYNYTCLRCGKKEPEIKLTPDHVIPLTKEGTNMIDNIQPLCLPCNTWKRTKIIDYRPQWEERNAI